MSSRWLSERQGKWRFVPGDKDLLIANGRTFWIQESFALSFGGDFKMHGPFYEVREWAVLDHEPHYRSLKEGFRGKARAEEFIWKEAEKAFDKVKETEAARPVRLEWLEKELLRAERTLKQARRLVKETTKSPRLAEARKKHLPIAEAKAKKLRREVSRTKRMMA